MAAAYSAFARPAMFAGQDCAKRMPFSMCPACMAATPNHPMIGTGVLASVSLFVLALVHIVTTSLVVSLVVLLSLILIGLTGLRGLVGLTVGLNPGAAQGD